MPTLEIGTGFKNKETDKICQELIKRGVLNEFGRMIDGVVLRFENSDEETYVDEMSVDEIKDLLTKNGVSF